REEARRGLDIETREGAGHLVLEGRRLALDGAAERLEAGALAERQGVHPADGLEQADEHVGGARRIVAEERIVEPRAGAEVLHDQETEVAVAAQEARRDAGRELGQELEAGPLVQERVARPAARLLDDDAAAVGGAKAAEVGPVLEVLVLGR